MMREPRRIDHHAPAELSELISHCPETGSLTWKRRGTKRSSFNTAYAGRPALVTLSEHGYLVGEVHGIRYYAHRVCWALHYGSWPRGLIDHIDANKTNNRIENLRDVSFLENSGNRRPNRHKASGLPVGVREGHTSGTFLARIRRDNVEYHLGTFDTVAEASAAYKGAKKCLGFHPNHSVEQHLLAARSTVKEGK